MGKEILMKKTIYYFTGTGNSLHIARKLAEGLENCSVKKITESINDKLEEHDIIGVVCPNYSYDVPHIVADFFKKLKREVKYNYLFVTVSTGGEFGYVSQHIQKRLKNANLKSIFQHYMPFNYLPFGDVPDEETQQQMFKTLETELKASINIINRRESKIEDRKTPASKKMKLMFSMAYPLIPQLDRMFKLTEECNGCELCKKICPVDNITIEKEVPKWNHKCQQCYACVHWCPKKAILAGKRSTSQSRYHHPDIKIEELM